MYVYIILAVNIVITKMLLNGIRYEYITSSILFNY